MRSSFEPNVTWSLVLAVVFLIITLKKRATIIHPLQRRCVAVAVVVVILIEVAAAIWIQLR
jgi:hypothetical protein